MNASVEAVVVVAAVAVADELIVAVVDAATAVVAVELQQLLTPFLSCEFSYAYSNCYLR